MSSDPLRLDGCRTTPLAGYLKALGVLRLVGTQLDSEVTGWWEGTRFRLAGVDADDLISFFTDVYAPTPVVSPWNGGSGFHDKDNKIGIDAIASSDDPRFDAYRSTIKSVRSLVADQRWTTWDKPAQVAACRNTVTDDSVGWLDAAIVLTANGPAFPPILGTGGNDGRLEFSNNFMQRLVDVVVDPKPEAEDWLRASLFAADSPRLIDGAIGQFDPAAAGGANSSAAGVAANRVNPWDYVLMIEGALWLASGVARRLGSHSLGRAAMPFTVIRSELGTGGDAGGEDVRGEFFAPLWDRPVSARELERLVSEGRADWRGRQARTGVDFVRAASTLGVDRGIKRFQRYTFSNRFGRTFVAVPAGVIQTSDRPEVNLLAELDWWIDNVRRIPNAPASITSGLRRVDRAQFEAATDPRTTPTRFLDVLLAVAALEASVRRSAGALERVAPLGPLSADWLAVVDDASAEFRVAWGVASAHDDRIDEAGPVQCSVAGWLRSAAPTRGRRWEWELRSPATRALGPGSLGTVVTTMLARRLHDTSGATGDQPHQTASFARGATVPLDDLALLVAGRLDEQRIDDLTHGLALIDPRAFHPTERPHTDPVAVPPLLAVSAPFFARHPIWVASPDGPTEIELTPRVEWGRMLQAGALDKFTDSCLSRLRIAGLSPTLLHVIMSNDATAATGRLSIALCCQLARRDVDRLLSFVIPNPNTLMETSHGTSR